METLKAKKKNGQMDFLLYVTVLLLCQRRDTGTSSVTRKIRNVLTAYL